MYTRDCYDYLKLCNGTTVNIFIKLDLFSSFFLKSFKSGKKMFRLFHLCDIMSISLT